MEEFGKVVPASVPDVQQPIHIPEAEEIFSRREGFFALGSMLIHASLPAAVVTKQAAPAVQEVVARPLKDISQAAKSAKTIVDAVDNLPAALEKDVSRRVFLPAIGKVALGKIPGSFGKIEKFAHWAARSMFPMAK